MYLRRTVLGYIRQRCGADGRRESTFCTRQRRHRRDLAPIALTVRAPEMTDPPKQTPTQPILCTAYVRTAAVEDSIGRREEGRTIQESTFFFCLCCWRVHTYTLARLFSSLSPALCIGCRQVLVGSVLF